MALRGAPTDRRGAPEAVADLIAAQWDTVTVADVGHSTDFRGGVVPLLYLDSVPTW
jgi:hypothetical protein